LNRRSERAIERSGDWTIDDRTIGDRPIDRAIDEHTARMPLVDRNPADRTGAMSDRLKPGRKEVEVRARRP